MIKRAVIVVILGHVAMHALAVNKCTDANGKVVFQDAACSGKGEEIKVTPSGGHFVAPAPATAPVAATPPPNGTQKLLETMQSERVRCEKWVVMNEARSALTFARNQCDKEQAQLSASKAMSKNNIAGATRDASISQEMTAAAMVCDSRTRAKERDLDNAEKVCSEIKCISPAY